MEPIRVEDPERSRAYHRWQFRLSALGFAVTVLREPLTMPLMLAALLIVAGVALAQRR